MVSTLIPYRSYSIGILGSLPAKHENMGNLEKIVKEFNVMEKQCQLLYSNRMPVACTWWLWSRMDYILAGWRIQPLVAKELWWLALPMCREIARAVISEDFVPFILTWAFLTLNGFRVADRDTPLDVGLPNEWVWDMIDEFMYQFTHFCTYRAKADRLPSEELMMLKDSHVCLKKDVFAYTAELCRFFRFGMST